VTDPVRDVEQLETLLSEPNRDVVDMMRRLPGDILVLGVGGKMGPTLARMARRASDVAGAGRRVIGVARFSSPGLEQRLQSHGVETIRADLLDPDAVAALPDAPNVVFMAGMKFGTTGQQPLTWAMNVVVPGIVARRFAHSRIVALSTGNVYGMVSVEQGGSRETDEPCPVGEYANSCLGRERIFEHYAARQNTPTAILRLNYAVELRYGVLVDLARKVHAERPIDLAMGYVNVIWQADANAMILRALPHADVPAAVINVAGSDVLRVREVSRRFGEMLGKPVRFTGDEAGDSLLSNGLLGYRKLGHPAVTVDEMMTWIADWVSRGGESLGKPTHFESRDGRF
jgi:nucleoside-diphosphate-sugar epimerase